MLRFRRYRVCRQFMVLSSIFLIFFSLSICLSHKALATTSTLTISIADTIELDAMPSTNGSFAASTATNNISVKTNNGTGYTLGIKASTEGSNALNKTGGGSIPSLTVAAGISESTYRTNTAYNNTWGFRPSKLNSASNSNYLPGPTSATDPVVLDRTSSANPTIANNYSLAIGTRVNSNTAPGSYSNTFVITVVANPIIYSISYNKNTTDSVTNMPANVINQETISETVTLSNNTPTRNGYNFQGWCTTAVADGADCTGTSYSAGSNWTIDQTAASNSLSLYARWKISTNPYCTNWATCMQNTETPPACGTTMTDGRDGVTYTTATIGGACWMTRNLRFEGAELKVGETNVTSNRTISPYGALTSGNSYTEARKQYNNNTNYGAYYNFCAASAQTACSGSSSQTATQDICPAGWHLPTQAQLSAVPRKNSYFTATAGFAGYYKDGTLNKAGSVGDWWGATAVSAIYQYGLYYENTDDNWGVYNFDKYSASSIRCVRAYKTMQDVNQWKDELTTVGEQIIVVDKRDGKEYWVAKQADGNIWMTQNLDLDIDSSKTYTPADTDVLSNWTPSASTYSTGTTAWNNSGTAPESYNPGDRCWNGTIDTSWSGTLDNRTIACNIGNHYHIGNYYNWTAAIAMNDSSSYSSDNQDANQSICPAGWRLPTRLGNKSYDNLVNALSLTAGTSGNIQKTPVYFPYAGSWFGSSHYVGTDSRYWSSVNADSTGGAYILYFSADNEFWTNSRGWKGYGDSVRCVAR